MSLEEGGKLSDVLIFIELCIFIVSLVNSILKEPEEYSVAIARITQNAKAIFEPVNAVEKECVGRKVQQIYQNYVMTAGSN
jgi:hypothetical protein